VNIEHGYEHKTDDDAEQVSHPASPWSN